MPATPAAVCPLVDWLPDETLQSIAVENNLSETAFIRPEGEGFGLRWFTPGAEVDLCGHATLGAAFVIATYLQPERQEIAFQSRSGLLTVSREGELFTLDFPALSLEAMLSFDEVTEALGARPAECWNGMDVMAVFESEAEIRNLALDQNKLRALDTRGVIATAPGEACDFVSRFFAPRHGIPEDPVTGSAHCAMTPFWAERLGKTRMEARQISRRGGELTVEQAGERIKISGRAVPYMVGRIYV